MSLRFPALSLPMIAPYTGVFAHGMGQSMFVATLPPLGRSIGLQEVQIGTMVSLSALIFFLFSRLWGGVSDRHGRKVVIMIGLAGYSLGTLVLTILIDLGMRGILVGSMLYWLLVVTRMGQAVVMSGTGPGTAAYIADVTTSEQRTAGMGRIAAANNIGSILGPALAGLLAGVALLLPMLFAAAITGIATWLVWKHVPATKPVASTSERKKLLGYLDPRIRGLLGLSVIVFTALSVVYQTLAFRLQDLFELTPAATAVRFGYLLMTSAATSLLTQILIVQRMNLSPMRLLRIGTPLFLVAMLLLLSATNNLFFELAMIFMGCGLGMAGPGLSAASSLAVSPSEQGAVAGMTTAMPAMGFVAGPLLGTALYQLNPTYPYAITAAILVVATVLAYQINPGTHSEESVTPQ